MLGALLCEAHEEGLATRKSTSQNRRDPDQQVVESSIDAHRQSESHPLQDVELQLRFSARVGRKEVSFVVTLLSFAVTPVR